MYIYLEHSKILQMTKLLPSIKVKHRLLKENDRNEK
jgi:hypothetical protein